MKFVASHWRWCLVFSFALLLPMKNGFNASFGLLALLGLVYLIKSPREVINDAGVRLMLVLFALLWLPMVLALPDATNVQHSALTTLKFVRFPLAGIFMVLVLQDPDDRRRLILAAGVLTLLWCCDALVQFLFGTNLLGNASRPQRLTGIFHPRYRLGVSLAVLLPLTILAVHMTRSHWRFGWLLLPLPLTIILMTGSRAAWLMMLVVGFAYAVVAIANQGLRRYVRTNGLKVLAVIVIGFLVALQFPAVAKRAQSAAGVFSTDFETVDVASKRRLSIWAPAVGVAKEHWINGIGPRSFRYEFLEAAPADNFWMKRDPPGVTHPHMTVIEVLVETGLIGLVGYMLLLAIVVTFTWRRRRSEDCWAAGVCVLAALFPLNVHMATYGSFWSSVIWWLAVLWVAAYTGARSSDQPVS